ncbi:MAG: class I SAM-dependent methyltransferase [Acidimicrobiia bacterium]
MTTTLSRAFEYGYGVTDSEIRLIGNVEGKRILVLGAGELLTPISLSLAGAHVIVVDPSAERMSMTEKLSEDNQARVEAHIGEFADLAFLRADSIDMVFSPLVLDEIEDLDRVIRQSQRVLRTGASMVVSFEHPLARMVETQDIVQAPGVLPLGTPRVTRSFFDNSDYETMRNGQRVVVYPRSIAHIHDLFMRHGFKIDSICEPTPEVHVEPVVLIPPVVVFRARKEGL